MTRVYLDNAATTKIRPEALDAMMSAYSEFGNPGRRQSCGSIEGRQPRLP